MHFLADGDEQNERGADVAAFVIAQDVLERVQSYVDRGRRFAGFAADELQETMVDAYKGWASDVGDETAHLLVNDTGAEYLLRKQEPPLALVSEEIDRICKTVADVTRALDPERLAEIDDDMVRAYRDAHDRKN